jgi:hypothetical protein
MYGMYLFFIFLSQGKNPSGEGGVHDVSKKEEANHLCSTHRKISSKYEEDMH